MEQRRLDDPDYLIVCFDGIQFSRRHVLVVHAVDDRTEKRIISRRNDATDGKTTIAQFASWVEKQHSAVAGNLPNGLDDLGVPEVKRKAITR